MATVKDIQKALDDRGIAYPKSAKKAELESLLLRRSGGFYYEVKDDEGKTRIRYEPAFREVSPEATGHRLRQSLRRTVRAVITHNGLNRAQRRAGMRGARGERMQRNGFLVHTPDGPMVTFDRH